MCRLMVDKASIIDWYTIFYHKQQHITQSNWRWELCAHVISADNSLSKTLRLNWDVIQPYISNYLTLSVVFCFYFSCCWIREITSTILYLRREDVFYLTTSIISWIYTENHVIHGMIYNKNNERIYNTFRLKMNWEFIKLSPSNPPKSTLCFHFNLYYIIIQHQKADRNIELKIRLAINYVFNVSKMDFLKVLISWM